jgi:haloacetate dehalogenase
MVDIYSGPTEVNTYDQFAQDAHCIYSNRTSYGASTKEPSPSGDSLAHSKREWAKDIIEALDTTHGTASPPKVIPYGHDRGGRLAYRLALDFPERVVGAGVLDIVPTSFVWGAMRLENEHRETRSSWHWVSTKICWNINLR